jgi:mRNA interferase MazF
MRKGEIVLIPFPFTDLSGQKVRPALILHANNRAEDCLVAFISSRPQVRMHGFDIAVTSSKRNGLKFDSVVKVNKVATLQKKTVIGKLGTLESSLLEDVNNKLRTLFHL